MPVSATMRVKVWPRADKRTDGIAVMMPGLGNRPEDFERHGIVETVLDHTRLTPVAPNAHFGYYRTQQLLPRLRRDVLHQAAARGYEQVWLVGVSLGGMGSLVMAGHHPERIAGVI